MKKIVFLLFLCQHLWAQTVYQTHEVSPAAEPRGGISFLQKFIDVNLQIPFQARLKGVKGRVFVSFVVEPDGTTSDVKVIRGLNPHCDAEALRLMRLFRAWQPAQKEGIAVRQQFNYGVIFPPDPVTNFDSTQQALVQYFDKVFQPTDDPAQYQYRQLTPVDSNGVVNGNISIEARILGKWKTNTAMVYERKEMKHKFAGQKDSVDAYQIRVRDAQWEEAVPVMTFQKNGRMISSVVFGPKHLLLSSIYYYQNGAVKEIMTQREQTHITNAWFDNGQMRAVTYNDITAKLMNMASVTTIAAVWDKDGKQLVKDGNGSARLVSDLYDGKVLTETGNVIDGLRQGKWMGKYADSTSYYEENYQDGKLTAGVSYDNGQQYKYAELEKPAEFKGGSSALSSFLSNNINYPSFAQKSNISGKVFVSFIVCTDGSTCDYDLKKGIGGGCDEEALRVVKKMNGRWQPGYVRGQPVRVQYNLPVSFVLE